MLGRPDDKEALKLTLAFYCIMEGGKTILEPGALDGHPQGGEALPEQLLIRQIFPGIFPARHGYPEFEQNPNPDGVIGCRRQQPPGPARSPGPAGVGPGPVP